MHEKDVKNKKPYVHASEGPGLRPAMQGNDVKNKIKNVKRSTPAPVLGGRIRQEPERRANRKYILIVWSGGWHRLIDGLGVSYALSDGSEQVRL